jgi:hypothetical protein
MSTIYGMEVDYLSCRYSEYLNEVIFTAYINNSIVFTSSFVFDGLKTNEIENFINNVINDQIGTLNLAGNNNYIKYTLMKNKDNKESYGFKFNENGYSSINIISKLNNEKIKEDLRKIRDNLDI